MNYRAFKHAARHAGHGTPLAESQPFPIEWQDEPLSEEYTDTKVVDLNVEKSGE